MKNLTIFLFIFFSLAPKVTFSQLYVGQNSYLCVTGRFVYETKNITIEDNTLNALYGKIYLRYDGQLLQGNSGASANSGTGNLSVFQEGTADKFQYNYWCSPVGSTTPSSGNGNFWIDHLYAPSTFTASSISTETSGEDGTATPLTISNAWIFRFLQTFFYEGWSATNSTERIEAGEGFTMKGSGSSGDVNHTTVAGVENNPDGSHQRYDFRGRPNSGNTPVFVKSGMLTLTGNPYPSAIDLADFLTNESNCTGIAYFWEQNKTVSGTHHLADYVGGYGTFSPATGYVQAQYFHLDPEFPNVMIYYSPAQYGENFRRSFTPIGQGFFIEGTTNGSVTMKDEYRRYVPEGYTNYSQFDRMAGGSNPSYKKQFLTAIASPKEINYIERFEKQVPEIRLNILQDKKLMRELSLAFNNQATAKIDRAMDARLVSNTDTDNYFVLENNKEFAINVLPFEMDAKIPLGFRNKKAANYKLGIKFLQDFDLSEHIYLHDKLSDKFYDLKNEACELNLPAGVNNNQFEITFSRDILSTNPINGQNICILQDNTIKSVLIANPNLLPLSSIVIYDMGGKIIYTQDSPEPRIQYEINTANLSSGVYIVKLKSTVGSDFNTKINVTN
ncbi:MAG: hypothetical protein CFE23_11650 [Flavobacterium sp. BFFFF1]|uniref:T9SS type A sorting domain-containing protein n=1 Tax=Flavobacterium sp. BFFFF1 TaxID=2015557 RepID=UPI000BC54E4C|nr:T9SS type A sorting domain-containing protein [Flavobacterium sp. BFFFF1]OYU79903.1 MAG: hypothetical protein CFE23_11650 [Flavobacterium sp. BFFFF1]